MLALKGRGTQSLPPIISNRRLAVSPSCGVPGRSISRLRDAIVLLRSLMESSDYGSKTPSPSAATNSFENTYPVIMALVMVGTLLETILAIPRGVEPRTPLRQRGIIAVRPWDRNLMLAALVLTTLALAFRDGQADDQRLNSAGLGAPIPRSTVYIYDRWLNLVPPSSSRLQQWRSATIR